MREKFRSWLPMVVAFVVGATMVGSAWAAVTVIEGDLTVKGTVKAKSFRYTTPKTQRLVVPGSAFIADESTDDVNHGNYSGAVVFGSGGGTANAPLYLPHGAVIQKVTWVHDGGSMNFHLERNFSTDHEDMLDKNSSPCGVSVCSKSYTAISPRVINNNKSHYGIFLNGSDARLYKFVIVYTTTTAVGGGQMPTGAGLSWQGGGSSEH
jgi:hypothetical protein